MVACYFVLVVIYFLFGYLFLPDEICTTGWYFGGAVLFPFVVFAIIGVLIGKGIIKPPPPKEKGGHDIQQSKPSGAPPLHDVPPPSVISSRNFENRLLRARTEPIHFLRQQLINGQSKSQTLKTKSR